MVYPNDQETVLSYFDVLGDQRVQRIRHQNSAGRVLSQFDYTYETTGEIRTQGRYQPPLRPARTTYTYRYDRARQLRGATLESQNSTLLKTSAYVYDAAGNRTAEDVGASHRPASFNNANQLVALQRGAQTWDFTYDANGNLLSDGRRTFAWDARDRLTAMVSGNRRSEFSYDGFDRRVRIVEKENGAVVSDVWLLWCGSDICEQRVLRQGTSRLQKRFFSLGETDGGHAYFYIRDHLGSIRQMTDNDSAVVASYDYNPYGRLQRGTNAASVTFGYAGSFWHAASSLNLTQFRAYNPNLGRWLSRDPLGEDEGLNLYRYVHNNPVNWIDPLGLSDLDWRPESDRLEKASLPSLPNYLVLDAHGTRQGVYVPDPDPKKPGKLIPLTAQEVVARLKAWHEWQAKKAQVKGVIIGACNVGNNSSYLRAVALGLGLPVYAPNDYLNIGGWGGQSVRVGNYSGFHTGLLFGKGFRGFDPSTGEFTVRQWWQLQRDSNSP